MQSIERHIIPLLRQHDCVIVPGFGGFLLSIQPSRISISGNEIFPPSRLISFNRSLTGNDGLLANAISAMDGISYLEALNQIKEKVEQWKDKMLYFKEIRLYDIGVISLIAEDKWEFHPASTQNFLDAAFGLTSVQLTPVEEQPSYIDINATIKRQQIKLNYISKYALVAVLLGVIGLSGFYFKENYKSLAFLSNPWHTPIQSPSVVKKTIINQPQEATLAISTQIQGIKVSSSESLPTANEVKSVSVKGKTKTAGSGSPEESNKDAGPVVTVLNASSLGAVENTDEVTHHGFYVIGGSFSQKQNAKKFAWSLKKKGYKSELIENNDGMFRVAYLKDTDSASANEVLQNIRSKENQSAWILKW